MGNRSLIVVRSAQYRDNEIRIYGHWSGTDNVQAVRNVLARTSRVGDVDYLTAQLFHEFSVNLGGYDGELSFGISLCETGSNEGWIDTPTVYIDADVGYYKYDGKSYTYEIPEVRYGNCEPNIVYNEGA